MNLRPPPITGNPELDDWLQEAYRFLQYPHFHQIRLIERATASEEKKGVIFLDSDDDTIKGHNGTTWKNFY